MTDCIEWGRARTGQGYGQAWDPELKRTEPATHHVLREQLGVDVPSGMVVMHTCDNPPCVNVDHLRIGTHADNQRDKKKKGRAKGRKGRDLTESEKQFIVENYEKYHPEHGAAALSRKYGASPAKIMNTAAKLLS